MWLRTVLVVIEVGHARVVLVLDVIRPRLIPCDPIRGPGKQKGSDGGLHTTVKDPIADMGIAYCSLSFGS